MKKFLFRVATDSDIPAITAIYNEIHTLEEKGIASTGWVRNIYPTEKTAADALARGELYVCTHDDTVIGSAIINKTQPDSYKLGKWQFPAREEEVPVLHTLTVSPRFSGQGCGGAFVGFYEALARNMGCNYLRMDTQVKNLSARRLYARLGYCEVGIVPCIFNGIEGVELVLLEKKL